jgi:hypothetical protein
VPTLTKRLLDGLAGDGTLRIIGDEDLPGFGVQVTPAGVVSFCVTYRLAGKQRRRVIGRYGPILLQNSVVRRGEA